MDAATGSRRSSWPGNAFTDRVAVVTGATRGLGREIALALGRAGSRVVVVGRSTAASPNRVLPGTLEDVEREVRGTGAEVLAIRADVSNEDDVRRIAEETIDRFGRCDICVNNAAVSFLGLFSDVTVSKWRTAIGVNLLGPVMLIQALLPSMLGNGDGRVLNLGSGAAYSDNVVQLPYSITKLALERLTTGLAHQVAGSGVAVNCIRIDEVIPTEAVTYSAPHLKDTARCSPEEFARGALWVLAQPSNFSGEVLTMDRLRAVGALSG